MLKNQLLQNLTHNHKYNLAQIHSLKILSMNYNNLENYIAQLAEDNPFLEIDSYNNPSAHYEINLNQATTLSLQEELFKQINYEINYDICQAIIINLDSNGYLKMPLSEIQASLGCSSDDINQALLKVQNLYPYGVGARDLKECLKIQCRLSQHVDAQNAYLVIDYLQELAQHQYHYIAEQTKLNIQQIEKAYQLIKTLNPKPGANYSRNATTIIPDITITNDQEMTIEINDITQRIKIDDSYDDIDDEQTKAFISQFNILNQQLLKHLSKRNTTLTIVINNIIKYQIDYFIHQKPLKPMRLSDIAKLSNLSISTISRCVNTKTLQYNNNTIYLADLFTTQIDGYSSQYLKMQIKQLINQEDKKDPLSDQQISTILHEDGINISRRTISKYREQLHINNSNLRKVH